MAIDSVNSTPIIAGTAIGAAAGGVGAWKGAPILASKFAENMDVYVGQAKDKAFDKLVDAGINKVVEFTKTHKKSTIAIGAAALAVVGGLIGKVIADKKADKAE